MLSANEISFAKALAKPSFRERHNVKERSHTSVAQCRKAQWWQLTEGNRIV